MWSYYGTFMELSFQLNSSSVSGGITDEDATPNSVYIEDIYNFLCERYLISFKCNKSTSYTNMCTCALGMHTSECLHVTLYTNTSAHEAPSISCTLCDVVKSTKQLSKTS